MLGLGKEGQAYINLRHCSDCVINLPEPSQWTQVESIAHGTGRRDVPAVKQEMGYEFMPDKFAVAGWTRAASVKVKPDRVMSCPLQIEAQMVRIHELAKAADEDHDTTFVIIETRTLQVHAHANIVVPNSDKIDLSQWAPLLYAFRHYMAASGPLGSNFRA